MTDLIALHHEYEDRMLQGEALFEEIEADIDARGDLDQDEKAALWLCAWAQIPVARQEQKARQFDRLDGRPRSLDLKLERRIHQALGLGRAGSR
jgi:hypothetical protein